MNVSFLSPFFLPTLSLSLSLYFIPFLPFSFFIFLTLILAHVTSNSLFSSLFPVFAYFSHPVFSPLSIFLCSFTLRPLFHLSFEHVSHIFAFPSSPLYSTDSLFRSSSHFSPFFRSPFLPLFCPRRRKPNARSFIFWTVVQLHMYMYMYTHTHTHTHTHTRVYIIARFWFSCF